MILFYFVLYGEGFYIIKVLVIEFNFVYYIDEELFVIYENFIYISFDIIKKGMELISGEVYKGY